MDLGMDVTGDRKLGLRFEKFPEVAREALTRRITALTAELLDRVRAAEPEKTGKLRSETSSIVLSNERKIAGIVRIRTDIKGEYAKAAALEYGARKSTRVKEHAMGLSHFWAKAVEPRQVMVAAYNRKPDIAQHFFLRGPLEAMKGEIFAELEAAMIEAEGETFA